MAKDNEENLTDLEEIDFDFDDEEIDFDFDDVEDNREASLPKLAAKELKESMTDVNLERVQKAAKHMIPKKFKTEFDSIHGGLEGFKSGFEKHADEIKKEVGVLAKSMSKFLPENNSLKKWIEEKFDSEEEEKAKLRNQEEEEAERRHLEVQAMLASQDEIRKDEEALRLAFDSKRTSSTNDILTVIAKDIRSQKAYMFNQTSKYQARSLELKLKHIAITKDHANTYNRLTSEMIRQLHAIAKNTGLPDIVKQRMSENAVGDVKARFRNHILNNLTAEGSIGERIKNDLTAKGNEFGEYLKEKLLDLKENREEAKEYYEQLSDSAEMVGGKAALATKLGASQATEFLDKQAAKLISKKVLTPLSNTETGSKFTRKLTDFFDNPREKFNRLASKIEDTELLGSELLGAGIRGTGAIISGKVGRYNAGDVRREDLNGPSTLDARTKVSINKVIPGYLRMILAETYATRIRLPKDKSSTQYEVLYDYNTDKFNSKSNIQNEITKRISNTVVERSKYRRSYMSDIISETEGLNISKEDADTIANAMFFASRTTDKKGAGILKDKEFLKALPERLQAQLPEIEKAILTQYDKDALYKERFRDTVRDLRTGTPEFAKAIEEIFRNNPPEVLEELGLVQFYPEGLGGEYRTDSDRLIKLMYSTLGLNSKISDLDPESKKHLKDMLDSEAKRINSTLNSIITKVKNVSKATLDTSKLKFSKLSFNTEGIKSKYSNFKDNITSRMNNLVNDKNMQSVIKNFSYNTDSPVNIPIEEKNIGLKVDKNIEYKEQIKQQETRQKAEIAMRHVKDVSSSIEAIQAAKATNDPVVINKTMESIVQLGPKIASDPSVANAYTTAMRSANESIAIGKKLQKDLQKEKDPDRGLERLSKMKDTVGRFLPASMQGNIFVKGLKFYMGTLWKLEKFLWKNVYGKVAKGGYKAAKFGAKAMWGLGKGIAGAGLNLGMGLLGKKGGIMPYSPIGLLGSGLLGLGKGAGRLLGFGKKSKEQQEEEDRLNPNLSLKKSGLVNGRMPGTEKPKAKDNGLLGFLKGMGSKLMMVLGAVTTMFKKLGAGGLIKMIGRGLGKVVGGAFRGVAKAFGKMFTSVFSKIMSIIPSPGKLLSGAKNLITSGAAKVGGLFKTGVNAVTNLGSKAVSGAKSIVAMSKDFLIKGFNTCVSKFSYVTKAMYNKIVTCLKTFTNTVAKPLSKFLSPKRASKVLLKLGSKLTSLLIPAGMIWLAYDVGSIAYIMIKEKKSVLSAVALHFIGFDPWDENAKPELKDELKEEGESEEETVNEEVKEPMKEVKEDIKPDIKKEESKVVKPKVEKAKIEKPKDTTVDKLIKPKVEKKVETKNIVKEDVKDEPKVIKPKVIKPKELSKETTTKEVKDEVIANDNLDLKEKRKVVNEYITRFGKGARLEPEEIETMRKVATNISGLDPNFKKRTDTGMRSGVFGLGTIRKHDLLRYYEPIYHDPILKENNPLAKDVFAGVMDFREKVSIANDIAKAKGLDKPTENEYLNIIGKSRIDANRELDKIVYEQKKAKKEAASKAADEVMLKQFNKHTETLIKSQESDREYLKDSSNTLKGIDASSTKQVEGIQELVNKQEETNALLRQMLEANKANTKETNSTPNTIYTPKPAMNLGSQR